MRPVTGNSALCLPYDDENPFFRRPALQVWKRTSVKQFWQTYFKHKTGSSVDKCIGFHSSVIPNWNESESYACWQISFPQLGICCLNSGWSVIRMRRYEKYYEKRREDKKRSGEYGTGEWMEPMSCALKEIELFILFEGKYDTSHFSGHKPTGS